MSMPIHYTGNNCAGQLEDSLRIYYKTGKAMVSVLPGNGIGDITVGKERDPSIM
jgi:hypothetical protein